MQVVEEMKIRKVVKRAVAKMGGLAKTAKYLTERAEKDGSYQKYHISAVWNWVHRDLRGFPLSVLEYVEEATGIPREELRPDVPWRKKKPR